MCDLNSALAEDIAALPGMTLARTLELMLWRPYRTWDELEHTPGFDADAVAALKAAGATLEKPPAMPDWTPNFEP